tara:strand:+ start:132 stop:995 length:864 start_codon:yes stop_codon:yes gene_type:complete
MKISKFNIKKALMTFAVAFSLLLTGCLNAEEDSAKLKLFNSKIESTKKQDQYILYLDTLMRFSLLQKYSLYAFDNQIKYYNIKDQHLYNEYFWGFIWAEKYSEKKRLEMKEVMLAYLNVTNYLKTNGFISKSYGGKSSEEVASTPHCLLITLDKIYKIEGNTPIFYSDDELKCNPPTYDYIEESSKELSNKDLAILYEFFNSTGVLNNFTNEEYYSKEIVDAKVASLLGDVFFGTKQISFNELLYMFNSLAINLSDAALIEHKNDSNYDTIKNQKEKFVSRQKSYNG